MRPHPILLALLCITGPVLSACSQKADPCVSCSTADADNGETPDTAGGGRDTGRDASVPPDVGNPADVSMDTSTSDTTNDVTTSDMGEDATTDCLATERLCAAACAACPTDNVTITGCMDDLCVATGCEPGYELCTAGCCTPAGPAVTGDVSPQSFSVIGTSIALDSSGYPQISYRNFFGTNIEHAQWDGREWLITVVDTGTSPASTSLVVDGTDTAHVAWFEGGTYDLRYARQSASGWQAETVDALGDVGDSLSLDVDSMNRPHIAYRDATNGALKYARWDGAMWIVATIDGTTGSAGFYPSLDIDSAGRPHIAYADFSLYAVRYIRFDGAAWVTETVETRPAIPQYISLDLDASDQAHITYLDNPAQDLRYVRWTGSLWSGQIVDAEANYGYSSTVRIDSTGRPHVVYHDGTTDDARYAAFDGTTWQIQDLSATESIGPESSLALDANDAAHLSLSIKGPTPVKLRYMLIP